MKRIFLIVLDSFGIGELPDAVRFGDAGSNTLAAIRKHPAFSAPNLRKLGLFHIDGVAPQPDQSPSFTGCIGRMAEASNGKDTTVGHWEIACVPSYTPLPTYPNGFPEDFCREFSRRTGKTLLCNHPYSGTEVIRDYGEEQMKTGGLILYTSADSVCQLAAHEEVVPIEELYKDCAIAREMLQVGRVIARPFTGKAPSFERTPRRRDFSLSPPGKTILDLLAEASFDTISVGKIFDIFAGRSISEEFHTTDNLDGMEKTSALLQKDFTGLCFVNLVDFDMKYGHRNDVEGYAAAMTRFDRWLGGFLPQLKEEDALFITADHGCDPSTPSTDHSREYTPFLAAGTSLRSGVNLGTRSTFADIGKTILDAFSVKNSAFGTSFWDTIRADRT